MIVHSWTSKSLIFRDHFFSRDEETILRGMMEVEAGIQSLNGEHHIMPGDVK